MIAMKGTANVLRCAQFILLQLTLSNIDGSLLSYYDTKISKSCFSVSGIHKLDITECNNNDKILILDSIQGIGQDPGQCIIKDGDCSEPSIAETHRRLMAECSGMSSCRIPATVAWMPSCAAYSNYNAVMYKCVSKSHIINICKPTIQTLHRTAYIQSPGYPYSYPANSNCQCNITTGQGQRILLKFADHSVEWTENCVADVVQVREGGFRKPRCGILPRQYNITSKTNNVRLDFITDSNIQKKGFWIIAEALGELSVACGQGLDQWIPKDDPTTLSSTVTEMSTSTTSLPTTASSSQDYYSNYDKSEYDQDSYYESPEPDENYIEGSLDSPEKSSIDKSYTEEEYYRYDNEEMYKQMPGQENSIVDPDEKDSTRTGEDNNYENEKRIWLEGPQDRDKNSALEGIGLLLGIIFGCVLIGVIIIGLAFMVLWSRRKRHKESISQKTTCAYRVHHKGFTAGSPYTQQPFAGMGSASPVRCSSPIMGGL